MYEVFLVYLTIYIYIRFDVRVFFFRLGYLINNIVENERNYEYISIYGKWISYSIIICVRKTNIFCKIKVYL